MGAQVVQSEELLPHVADALRDGALAHRPADQLSAFRAGQDRPADRRRAVGEIGPGGPQGVGRETMGLRLVHLRPVEAQLASRKVAVSHLQACDLGDA